MLLVRIHLGQVREPNKKKNKHQIRTSFCILLRGNESCDCTLAFVRKRKVYGVFLDVKFLSGRSFVFFVYVHLQYFSSHVHSRLNMSRYWPQDDYKQLYKYVNNTFQVSLDNLYILSCITLYCALSTQK